MPDEEKNMDKLPTEEIDGEARRITWHLKDSEWVNVARDRSVRISTGFGAKGGSAKLRNSNRIVNVTEAMSHEYVTKQRDLITIVSVVPAGAVIEVHTDHAK